MYWRRGIEPKLVEALDGSPVVVLYGTRGVGKTRLCNELITRGHLRVRGDLQDPTTRAQADLDLGGWLRALPSPAAVDEAQLLAGLPLEIKRIVDERSRAGQFLLTGSTPLDRRGLGGSDPLARRQLGLTLWPLTQLEIEAGRRNDPDRVGRSVVDVLFDGSIPDHAVIDSPDRRNISRRMRDGGIPARVVEMRLATAADRQRHIETDIRAVLGEDGSRLTAADSPERFEIHTARRVLESLALAPGGVFNANALANRIGRDRRTVSSYVAMLERRFVVHRLDNLAVGAQKRTNAQPKMHPVDVAMSWAMLRQANSPVERDPQAFGSLFESLVVNELIAQAAWSRIDPRAYFWRDTKSQKAEVDLVLVDDLGRRVGIEVKSGTTVKTQDAAGMAALRAASGLHRCFVIYLGDRVVPLAEDVWAVPFGFLSSPAEWPSDPSGDARDQLENYFTQTRSVEEKMTDSAGVPTLTGMSDGPIDASLFISYVHADDSTDGGAIRHLAERLPDAYEAAYGSRIAVFVDHRDIRWGEEWQRRLDQELQENTFLIPFVTPRFLASGRYRDEVLEHTTVARKIGEPRLVLPLIWRDTPAMSAGSATDPVIEALKSVQWLDVSELRLLDPNSAAYRRTLDGIVSRLHDTIQSLAAHIPASAVPRPGEDEGAPDVIDTLEEFQDIIDQLLPQGNRWIAALGRTTAAMNAQGPAPTHGSAAAVRTWATRLAGTLAEPAEELGAETDTVREIWSRLDPVVARVIAVAGGFRTTMTGDQFAEFRSTLAELEHSFDEFDDDAAAAIGSAASGIGRVRRLRPFANTVLGALRLYRDMRSSAKAWSAAAS